MTTKLGSVVTCLLLFTSFGLSQADDTQYFTALVTTKDGNDRQLLNFFATPSLGVGRLVIMELTKRWTTSSIEVSELGRDFSIEPQGKTRFLLRFAETKGVASSMMIAYTYDGCLIDLKMTENTIALGKATFTEWNIWRRQGSDNALDEGPTSFLFPLCGIYPYWNEKERGTIKESEEELNKKNR